MMYHKIITSRKYRQLGRTSLLSLFLALSGIVGVGYKVSAAEATFSYENLLNATFSDTSGGGVSLTLSALGNGDDLDRLYFNLNPSLDASSLIFTPTESSGSTFSNWSVAGQTDAFKVDGGGKYDIEFDFPNNPISQGDSISFDITGITGLAAGDFYFISTQCAGGAGPTYSSAILTADNGQSITVLDDPKYNVPDNATTVLLLGMALVGVELVRRMSRKPLKPAKIRAK
jgi:hypothetical protein